MSKLELCLGLTALLACGCNKNPAPLTPLGAEQIQPVMRQAFAKADDETKAAAGKIAEDARGNDAPSAFVEIQELLRRQGLTMEQRRDLCRAQLAVSQQLSDAAQNGDQRAAETLHHFLSTK
jgi:hypothetical protein